MKKIGFIGQGWIGKHYANDFEMRGFETVRYGLEPQYAVNKERMKKKIKNSLLRVGKIVTF